MPSKDFTKALTPKPKKEDSTDKQSTVEVTTNKENKASSSTNDTPIVEDESKKKGKGGRKKTKLEPHTTINISIPTRILEQIEIAKCKYHNNMTEYINVLIQADLEKNMEKYKELYDLINDTLH